MVMVGNLETVCLIWTPMQIRGCFAHVALSCGLYPVFHGHGRFCIIFIETNNIKDVLIILKLPNIKARNVETLIN